MYMLHIYFFFIERCDFKGECAGNELKFLPLRSKRIDDEECKHLLFYCFLGFPVSRL